MNGVKLFQINKQGYISLETYRQNGMGVKTPVWFVIMDHMLYVRTDADSWKVKRIRRNSHVKIAPCTYDGKVLGDWVEGEATIITDQNLTKQISQAQTKKYGLLKLMFDGASWFKRSKTVTFSIRL